MLSHVPLFKSLLMIALINAINCIYQSNDGKSPSFHDEHEHLGTQLKSTEHWPVGDLSKTSLVSELGRDIIVSDDLNNNPKKEHESRHFASEFSKDHATFNGDPKQYFLSRKVNNQKSEDDHVKSTDFENDQPDIYKKIAEILPFLKSKLQNILSSLKSKTKVSNEKNTSPLNHRSFTSPLENGTLDRISLHSDENYEKAEMESNENGNQNNLRTDLESTTFPKGDSKVYTSLRDFLADYKKEAEQTDSNGKEREVTKNNPDYELSLLDDSEVLYLPKYFYDIAENLKLKTSGQNDGVKVVVHQVSMRLTDRVIKWLRKALASQEKRKPENGKQQIISDYVKNKILDFLRLVSSFRRANIVGKPHASLQSSFSTNPIKNPKTVEQMENHIIVSDKDSDPLTPDARKSYDISHDFPHLDDDSSYNDDRHTIIDILHEPQGKIQILDDEQDSLENESSLLNVQKSGALKGNHTEIANGKEDLNESPSDDGDTEKYFDLRDYFKKIYFNPQTTDPIRIFALEKEQHGKNKFVDLHAFDSLENVIALMDFLKIYYAKLWQKTSKALDEANVDEEDKSMLFPVSGGETNPHADVADDIIIDEKGVNMKPSVKKALKARKKRSATSKRIVNEAQKQKTRVKKISRAALGAAGIKT